MAKCDGCGKEMVKKLSCNMTHLELDNGTIIPRLRHDGDGHCPDCFAPKGGFHHMGCDIAVCPICGGQESFCSCPIASYGKVERKKVLA